MAFVNIGTSGWSFNGWKEIFYPPTLAEKDTLAYYSSIFETVELNSSFYRIPSKNSIAKWKETTPDEFIFSCKANRYLTHVKMLKEVPDTLQYFLQIIEGLGEKLGPVLFQLPPYWPINVERLKQFIQQLSDSFHYTFEFRNTSWLCQEVYDLLAQKNIALCFYDFKGFQCPEVITSDFIYLRLHGPHLEPYAGHYPEKTLLNYAHKFAHWQQKVKHIFCYLDNDHKVVAPHDAQVLQGLVRLTFNMTAQ
ncbi:DUF72 domain-containing protein [Fluoribacter dumoffii]|uniref:Protein of uncharacterized function DUF72 n=1 Tax=Fluoribacter dumoffii TaxID=463 RepID=A0A377GBV2_9GAMM|nr:DUF72 domain-containing protein [Fluoribacter dumoffii]KTC90613.1 hypothetical protein Ldum_1681 [Fluoribacter dumoffii NY 23]MCW8386292.1 DUF72 domain-containing protein [Fluoribacter dumoffii]MCW8498434.1 DUF72 domain-containing protein [Fluoribacter dumoffii]STO22293.1 Protein of uncharacterised function DUF72 [Fluoribacter dumoffii]